MEVKRASIPFKLSSPISDLGEFSGYGSIFGNVDLGGDIVEPGAFSKSLQAHKKNGTMPAMFYSHDTREPIGDWLEMGEDDTGLLGKGILWIEDVPRAKQARKVMRGTGPKGLSIGYVTKKYKMARVAHLEGGAEIDVRVLQEVDLLEVSPVVFAMNPLATITDAKGLDGALVDIRTLEKVLQNSLNLTCKQAKAFLSGGYSALKREVEGAQRDVEMPEEQKQAIAEMIAQARNIFK